MTFRKICVYKNILKKIKEDCYDSSLDWRKGWSSPYLQQEVEENENHRETHRPWWKRTPAPNQTLPSQKCGLHLGAQTARWSRRKRDLQDQDASLLWISSFFQTVYRRSSGSNPQGNDSLGQVLWSTFGHRQWHSRPSTLLQKRQRTFGNHDLVRRRLASTPLTRETPGWISSRSFFYWFHF